MLLWIKSDYNNPSQPEIKMERVILNNNLEAGTTPHRAVLLREPADKYAPNGNGDLIAI